MKKVSLLILVSMILLLAFTSCEMLPESVVGVLDSVGGTFEDVKNTVLGFVGIEPEVEHEHEWKEATCESPKTCECGETEGEALGHTWTEATCASPKTCSVCKKSEGTALKHEWVAADCENPATCKLCGQTSGSAVGHAWVEATCESAKFCAICNKVEGTPAGHDFADATCTAPKTCKSCGATEGEANGHSWTAADCNSPRTCSVCSLEDGEPLGHDFAAATCTAPKTCKLCSLVEGDALGHDMADATCTAPKTCKNGCGLTEGEALGHTFTESVVDPTCTEQGFTAHTCSVCGFIESDTYTEPTGHDWADATCIDPATCKNCGLTAGADPAGHDWADATCTAPMTCNYCGATEGEALGHVGGTAYCNALAICDVCGEGYGEYDAHKLGATGYDAEKLTVNYGCSVCGGSYVLHGYYADGTNTNNLQVVNNGADYKLNIVDGKYEMLYPNETSDTPAGQQQIWIPLMGNPDDFFDFSCANNAIGFLSFKVNAYNSYQNLQFKLNAERGATGWDWGKTSFAVFDITPVKSAEQTTVDLIGYGNKVLKTITVGEDKWTGWLDVVIGVQLRDDNTMALTYIVNGEFLGTVEAAMPITTFRITSVYINGRTSVKDSGFKFDDLTFAYSATAHWIFDNQVHTMTPATCTDPITCTCGATEGAPLGHTWADATCASPKTCTVCAATEGNPNGHSLVVSGYDAEAKSLTYACSGCGASYDLHGYYADGTNTNNLQVVNNGAEYKLNIVDGKYEMLYPNETSDTPAGQQQIWIPLMGNPDDFFDFSCANNAIGFLSFKVNAYNSYQNLQFKLNAERGATGWDWGKTSFAVFDITPVKSAEQTTVDLIGYGNKVLKTITVGEDKWTGWLDVVIGVQLRDDNTMALTYIVNGEFLGTVEAAMPITTFRITSVYINGRTSVKDSGFKLDDIVFGYTKADSHYKVDGQDHVKIPATCTEPERCACGFVYSPALGHDAKATCTEDGACVRCGEIAAKATGHNLTYVKADDKLTFNCVCGISYVVENYLEWSGDKETDAPMNHSPNGKVDTVYEDGTWGFIFNPEKESDWAAYGDALGAQLQPWMPSSSRNDYVFTDFSTEKNAVGIISFSMKTSLTRHENKDTNMTVGVGKPRNASDWGGGAGSWTDDFIQILVVEDYLETGVVVKGGVNASMTLATIPVANGWSEWFDVTMSIELLADGTMNTYYYINGVYCGVDTRNLGEKAADGRFLDPQKIEALQLSGWTYAEDTGVMFDNFIFGYTAGGHNTLTGEEHVKLSATCTEPERCSCGFVYSPALGHDAKATCTEDGACVRCGEIAAKATGHNLTYVKADDKLTFNCVCGISYVVENYLEWSGDKETDAPMNHSPNGKVDTVYEDGTWGFIFNPEKESDWAAYGDALGAQLQPWMPSSSRNDYVFTDFSTEKNAVGIISFSMKTSLTRHENKDTNMTVGVGKPRNASDWGGGAGSWTDDFIQILVVEDYLETGVVVKGGVNASMTLATIPVANGWSEWFDVTMSIELLADGTMNTYYYINGVYCGVDTRNLGEKAADGRFLDPQKIEALQLSGWTFVEDTGVMFDNFVFGYTAGGHNTLDGEKHVIDAENTKCSCGYVFPVEEEKLDVTPIAKEDVTNAYLAGVVTNKIKQWDQSEAHNSHNGTPVYVSIDKDGTAVQGLYFSKTTPWVGDEGEQFSEFRFNVDSSKKATSITFDYIIIGEVEENKGTGNGGYTFTDLDGNKFEADAYVQIKTPSNHPKAGDNYPELSGTDLVLDGQWHTMSYTFAEPLEITNILLNLYHFQGEFVISNVNVTFAE